MTEISSYHENLSDTDREICGVLCEVIAEHLHEATSKVWHGHPVWFLDGNPIVGYSKQKAGLRLMFWSGADFDEKNLTPGSGRFKDASFFYQSVDEVDRDDLARWLEKSKTIQWDYKNIVKHKGELVPFVASSGGAL